jgi:NifU-like protein involved in Fe-S cluster formation
VSYNELTRRYFEAPASAGVLSGAGVFRGAAGTAELGAWVQFDLQLAAGIIEAMRFLAFGCPHTIAVAAWLAEQAPGRAVNVALPESVQAIAVRFAVPVPKLGRLLTIEDAWAAAATQAIDSTRVAPIL